MTPTWRRLSITGILAGVWVLSLPAFGQEPAVPVTTAPPSIENPDWTYRFLVPTGIALAILTVLVTTVRYFTNVVRKRYRVVE